MAKQAKVLAPPPDNEKLRNLDGAGIFDYQGKTYQLVGETNSTRVKVLEDIENGLMVRDMLGRNFIAQEIVPLTVLADKNGAEGEETFNPLAPFSDDLPYDRNRVIQECKFCMTVEIQARFEVGKRMLLLKENEEVATWRLILEEHFSGMHRATCFRYMLFARKAAYLPRFQAFAQGKDNWSKALALLECCEDEDMQEFEDGGDILGIKRDELDGFSVRELKARIKKLKKENKEGVEKATRELEKENQGLRSDKEALEAALNGPEVEEVFKIIRKAEEKCLDAVGLLRQVPPAVLEREAGVRNLVFGSCEMLRRLIDQLEGEAQGALNRALVEEEVVAGDQ